MTPGAQAVYDELTGRKGIGNELESYPDDIAEELCEAVAAAARGAMRQIGWWYDGPAEVLPVEERFVDTETAVDEGPFVEPYAGHMVPVWIEGRGGSRAE